MIQHGVELEFAGYKNMKLKTVEEIQESVDQINKICKKVQKDGAFILEMEDGERNTKTYFHYIKNGKVVAYVNQEDKHDWWSSPLMSDIYIDKLFEDYEIEKNRRIK